MVGVERFELPTPWSQTRCATRLRYTPIPDIQLHPKPQKNSLSCKFRERDYTHTPIRGQRYLIPFSQPN